MKKIIVAFLILIPLTSSAISGIAQEKMEKIYDMYRTRAIE